MYDYRRGESILGAFILGGIVGAALGLLFSPRSGRENREFVAAKAQEYWGEGREFYETSRAKVVDETEELRAKIDAARDRLKDQVDTVTQQAKGKVHEMAPAAKDAVGKAGQSVKTGVDSAETKAQGVLDKLADKTAPAAPDAGITPDSGAPTAE
ncbi:MAG: YtxH domain-containing protein [Coriobacteriia bacterium]|nr:YtxH domain-containing protein [Coriobacteriia bacterium]